MAARARDALLRRCLKVGRPTAHRLAVAVAVVQHRPVGSGGEALIPLEILVGLILMSSWRALHSAYTPRL